MSYHIKATSVADDSGSITVKNSVFEFGTTSSTEDSMVNPAEIFLGSLASCILKNVERFSRLLKFDYLKANIVINAQRLDEPPRMDDIFYELTIYSQDQNLNTKLLQKNLEKFGTIYNTIKQVCTISGTIKVEPSV
ncbi:OsmC family protein [Allomuricauda sp. F6463D]|uniref:OsmC family protein n=1 Tax=Allomuricauda sp. F6463D TaxID=2926409 RepID=UPI001FF61395|nr:OsmC family protein [Muricauda sp. F6463D]MCK0159342.1 OsmC family protein [Muricauda sp. F6463D]